MDQGDSQTKLDVQHQMEQLDAFFQTNLDMLGIFDASARAVRLNPAWEQALGYPMHELVGACILDFVHPNDSEVALGAIAQLRDRIEVRAFLSRFRHQRGGYRWLEWRITVRDDLIFASVRDVTDAKLKEAALLKSEDAHKMDSLGSLAGGVAHDMNNILGAVMGLASSIRLSTRDDVELREDMDAMIKACERGRNLVRGLLDFARQDLAEARVFNLNTVVNEQTSLLRVLLIDDDELIQKSVSAQLRRLGHQVTLASNGHEALMKLEAGLQVDLALLDITMPILDGASTLPHLRRLRPGLGVILATGKVDDATTALTQTFGGVTLLPKPYTLGELKSEIAPWLERLGLTKSK